MQFTARDRLKLLAGISATALGACGGGGTSGVVSQAPVPQPSPPPPPTSGSETPSDIILKDRFSNNFLMGTALTGNHIDRSDASVPLAQKHFNSLTPDYELKPNIIAPTEGVYNFDPADRIVDWGLENNMQIRGHALLWHEATPDYFLRGSRDDIRGRLEDYIFNVLDHFKGRIEVWDVVNEVISVDVYSGDQGVGPDRQTAWLEAVGNADYIDWAFLAAREADPNLKLFLNDYQTEDPIKRGWLIEIIERLRVRNIPIDGIGHQFHLQLNTDPNEVLAAIDAVDNQFMGLINHITEMDVNFYQDPGSCWETETNCDPDYGSTPPTEKLAAQAQLLKDVFDGLETRPTVESLTFWGVRDNDSWLNYSPIERSNYPLLFDRDGDPKPVFHAITDPDYIIP